MDIAILLVAGKNDPTYQNEVENVLGRCNYEVFRKKTVEGALQAVGEKEATLDLVITNVQILESVGHEIIHNIQKTLNLKVLPMGSAERINQKHELQLTFSLYIVENLSMNYLKILLGHSNGSSNSTIPKSGVETSGTSSSSITHKPKKTRFIWTSQMKKKFQDAIEFLGNENAVPMKILQHMDVPGLTRNSVSSYLQTYRMSKKCSELDTTTASSTVNTSAPYYNPSTSENMAPVYDLSSLPLEGPGHNSFFSDPLPPIWSSQNSQNFDHADWYY